LSTAVDNNRDYRGNPAGVPSNHGRTKKLWRSARLYRARAVPERSEGLLRHGEPRFSLPHRAGSAWRCYMSSVHPRRPQAAVPSWQMGYPSLSKRIPPSFTAGVSMVKIATAMGHGEHQSSLEEDTPSISKGYPWRKRRLAIVHGEHMFGLGRRIPLLLTRRGIPKKRGVSMGGKRTAMGHGECLSGRGGQRVHVSLGYTKDLQICST